MGLDYEHLSAIVERKYVKEENNRVYFSCTDLAKDQLLITELLEELEELNVDDPILIRIAEKQSKEIAQKEREKLLEEARQNKFWQKIKKYLKIPLPFSKE